MMKKENLIKARELLNLELSSSINERGTDWYYKLCCIRGELDSLITILDDIPKYEQRKRMFK